MPNTTWEYQSRFWRNWTTFKKGNDNKNYEAREFIRLIDKLAKDQSLQEWIPLNGKTRGKFKVIMDDKSLVDAQIVFNEATNDHRILNAALTIKQQEPSER